MSKVLSAILLSALIFPGLGQVYKRDVRKGVFLILSASLLLAVLVLGVLILYGYAYAELLAQVASPEDIEPAQLRGLLIQVLTRPLILFTFGLLLATWVYSIFDAARRTVVTPGQEII
ncbi:MAG: hypothetical protein FJ135_11385 [Deltaproteobacteria bacterium]|nr:hypothetical protein [Deltaproteobacteria bacterium]